MFAHHIFANSNWTRNHLVNLWEVPNKTTVLYPPCNVSEFQVFPMKPRQARKNQIISVAQFRPEKNHRLQIQAFCEARKIPGFDLDTKLVLIGGVRGQSDEMIFQSLKEEAEDLGVIDHMEFKANLTFDELKNEMATSKIGLHTMLDEHFGISIVEMMAAGLYTIAHNSGGPKEDIIGSHNKVCGALAVTKTEYAEAIN